MAVRIRLRRMGRNKEPFYRVVVTDTRHSTRGRFIEKVGWYDPKLADSNHHLDMDRVQYWLQQGALVSDTVRSFLKKTKAAQA